MPAESMHSLRTTYARCIIDEARAREPERQLVTTTDFGAMATSSAISLVMSQNSIAYMLDIM